MFDIKWIRENPEVFDEAMKLRGLEPQAKMLVDLDDKRRAHVSKILVHSPERRDRQLG